MPNWCYNQTIFYGDKEKLKNIYNNIHNQIEEKPWVHIDLFLKELGCSEEDLTKKYPARAFIDGIKLLGGGELELQYESAWNPINEVLDEILEEYQPQIKEVTLAEECGNGVFINTDFDGKYYPEKYYLDLSITGENPKRKEDYNDIKYHNDLESVANELKTFFKFYNFKNEKMETEEEIRKAIRKLEDYDDVYITFESFF